MSHTGPHRQSAPLTAFVGIAELHSAVMETMSPSRSSESRPVCGSVKPPELSCRSVEASSSRTKRTTSWERGMQG